MKIISKHILMFIYLLILLVIIVIFGCYKTYSHEPMSDYNVNLQLNIQTTKKTLVTIFYQKKKIGSLQNGETRTFKVNNMNYHDKLDFIVTNNGGKGGFICEIKVEDGQIFYTNRNSFTLIGQQTNSKNNLFPEYSGGKYLGCYQDKSTRTLPNMKNNINSVSQCHNYAVQDQYPFYGLQAGQQCFMGYDYLQAQKISDYNCAIKFPKNKIDYGGGIWTNAIYSSIEAPDIIEIKDTDREKRRNISSKAKWIWIKGMGIHDQFVQGEWKFEWKLQPKKDRNFCPNPDFNDFIPTGCSNPKNKDTCTNTVDDFYKNNEKTCLTKINPMSELRDGNLTVRLINCFDMIPNSGRTKIHHDFIDNLLSLYKISCNILEKCPNSYCSLLKLSENPTFINDCKKLHISDRICPDNIKADSQSCSVDSYDCDYLENECKYNNYCWDKFTLKGPKCFIPKRDLGSYIDFKDSKILSAIEHAGMYLNTNPINKKTFKQILLSLIKSCKLLEFSKSKNTSCHCTNNGICYPC